MSQWRWKCVRLMGILALILLIGCTRDSQKRLADLDFTVVAAEEIPADLASIIEEKREREFRLTYANGNDLYLICGYGKQPTGGFSIQVKDLYLTENAIILETELLGPGREETGSDDTGSTPVMVLKTEYREEPVIFR